MSGFFLQMYGFLPRLLKFRNANPSRDIMPTPMLNRSSLMIHLICVFNVLHSAIIFMKSNSCSVNYNDWT